MRRGLLLTMAGAIGLALTGALYADGQAVTVTAHESDRRVDITIGGQPFTSYIWPDQVKKPNQSAQSLHAMIESGGDRPYHGANESDR